MSGGGLNIFYEEPDRDRWLAFDRYPRRAIRRAIRGKRQPGGQERVFLNLRTGLDKLGVEYRVNDYNYARKYPDEVACIIGKPHVLDKQKWANPIVFGAATFSHPVENPDLLARYPTIWKILVPGEWMKRMWQPYYSDLVEAWPVGIDTDRWMPSLAPKPVDFLIYNKVRWHFDKFESELIRPVEAELRKRHLSFIEIRYGDYREEEYEGRLHQCRAMIFLCEHETQGIAYQQALSAGVPILAWDRGCYWQDPAFYPHRVKFGPVSSVPYWDDRCGVRFTDAAEFPEKLDEFLKALTKKQFAPRNYILENLTLETCASRYVEIVNSVCPGAAAS